MNLTGLSFTGTTSDGIRAMWKDNFESFYTEVAELGRWDSWEFIHTVLMSHGFLYKNQSNIAIVLMLFLSLRGRFSVVKRCDQRGSKRTVAVKFVNKKLMKRDQVTHEFNVLQRLQHPHLVRLLDTFETSSSYALVLEMWELTYTHTHTLISEWTVTLRYVCDHVYCVIAQVWSGPSTGLHCELGEPHWGKSGLLPPGHFRSFAIPAQLQNSSSGFKG